jgi:hypothetical protein
MPKKQSVHDLFTFAGGDWNRAFVAGGYAVEPTKALDVDLWVPASPGAGSFADRADVILADLQARKIDHVVNMHPYPDQLGPRFLVATIENAYDGKDVQLLITSHRSAQELVDSFDISTHMLARDVDGKATFGKNFTSNRVSPKVCRWDTPSDTLKRLRKISQRYRIDPNPCEVWKLEDLSAREINKRKAA